MAPVAPHCAAMSAKSCGATKSGQAPGKHKKTPNNQKGERSKVTITEEQCTQAIIRYVGDPTQEEFWMTEGSPEIIKRYGNFLQALLALTPRIPYHMLKRSVKHVWELNWDYADAWAQKLTLAFGQLRTTARTMTDGSRMDRDVANVALRIKRTLTPSPSPSSRSPRRDVKKERTISQAEIAIAIWEPGSPRRLPEMPSPMKKELRGPPSLHMAQSTTTSDSTCSQAEIAARLWGDLPTPARSKEEQRDTDKATQQVLAHAVRAPS